MNQSVNMMSWGDNVSLELNLTSDDVLMTIEKSWNVSDDDVVTSSMCGNASEYEDGWCTDELGGEWFRHDLGMTVLCCFAYFAVFSLGIIGNGFVVIVVLRSPRMRTVTNFFIVNLAVADILVLVFCLPATLLANILVPWVLGWFMCKAVAYVQGLSVAASIYSLVALSFDRFLAICYPLRCQITRTRAKVVIVISWIVALIIPVPWAMYFELEPISELYPEPLFCREHWPSVESEKLYFLIGNLLLCYVIPLVVITYCYVMIWLKVWSRIIPVDCGFSIRQRIVGGINAFTTEFPWLVIIKYWHMKYCSGTLINDRYVLTAAHCLHRKLSRLFTVVINDHNINGSSSEISFKVEKIIINPNFDPITFDYDIALILLTKSVVLGPQLRPICLPTTKQRLNYTETLATIVGWGDVIEGADEYKSSVNQLNKLQISIVSNEECKLAAGLKSYLISSRMMCAGNIRGGQDACQGDSGGPLLVKSKGKWLQIGIISWGVGCARPNYYGVYTRLSEFQNWIKQLLQTNWSC
ncbi:hypothetical protein CHUAL_008933 [Chamberlinius hualienensis]